MFCFQCEQTAGGKGCTSKVGVCGKTSDVADLQDQLTEELVNLAKNIVDRTKRTDELVVNGLFTTLTNVSFDEETLKKLIDEVVAEREAITGDCDACASPCDKAEGFKLNAVWTDNEDLRSLRSLMLLGMRGMAAYAHHAQALNYTSDEVNDFFYKGLISLSYERTADEWLGLLMELGQANLKALELLDEANTKTFGTPVPTEVTCKIEKGPFIVISGHDLFDLKMLLEQTEGKGINIYTHGEMLPAHGYPELKKFAHLKGNFGTAWQNQQKEFADVPAAFLFTTNCIMPVKPSYEDRVYTTSVVQYPGLLNIPLTDGKKDFSPVIAKALELGGYSEETVIPGINGGTKLLTGFGHGTVLGVADKVIDAVKAKQLNHIFLVGGCDGARPGRNYFTDFAKQAPSDTLILTLACGKFRFNDLDLGTIGGIPRVLDMGQCNDSYSAIKVAVELAKAFDCGVNDLPLTLILSWYEQKAVSILLTLLSLGIRNIHLGPTLPAFISPNVLNILVEKFNISPTTDAASDLAKILGK